MVYVEIERKVWRGYGYLSIQIVSCHENRTNPFLMLTIFGIVSGGLVVTETFPVAMFSKFEKLLVVQWPRNSHIWLLKNIFLKLHSFKENVILKCGIAELLL